MPVIGHTSCYMVVVSDGRDRPRGSRHSTFFDASTARRACGRQALPFVTHLAIAGAPLSCALPSRPVNSDEVIATTVTAVTR